MTMSSCRRSLERSPISRHRPQDVDPPSGKRDYSLGVALALSPFAIVEGPGDRRRAQTGERRLVEGPFEHLVAAAHPSVVAYPFARVAAGRHKPSVSSELVGAREGRDAGCAHPLKTSASRFEETSIPLLPSW
jgi:hypothetical protein